MWLTGQLVRLILGGLVAVGFLIPMWRSSVEAVPMRPRPCSFGFI